MDKQNIQHDTLKDKHVQLKSKSVVKVSTVLTPNFIRHKVNTNLNLKPQNLFSLEAESLGVRYTSDDFHYLSSFQMANMNLDCIGNVDIVSDAKNIMNLCKIPYNNKSVSIMVHNIDKTLLLDEFDVEKYLIQNEFEKWVWLTEFFYKNIVKSSDIKVKCITYKNNNFRKIQNEILVSKFLHHTIGGLDSHNNQIKSFHNENSPLASSLPRLTPEEVFPDFPQIKQLFNRNFLWNFEDLQMLIGTNLPIFRSDNNSSLCTRLRDMSKSLSMFTGIDYWLENVMCNIPEIEFCYHKNGIVQKYELVKTEDIPYLDESTFSPNDISDIMQNTLSFLKSNANSVGHTYWLFKGKNDYAAKLYDLTTLCSESLIDSPNPFAVPLAVLLYRVAYKLKHDPKDGKLYNPVTIQLLLNNCLKLLDKTKYPEIVISINCMLSDMYISIYNNPSTVVINSTEVGKDSDNCYNDFSISSTEFDYGIYSVDIQNLCVSHKKEITPKIPDYFKSKNLVKNIEECYYKALYYIGSSLSCLQYFKNDKNIRVGRASLSESKNKPMQYLDSEIFRKNDIPNWQNLLNFDDNNWENLLRPIFYEKASDTYFNFGKNCLASKKFGIALKCFRRSFECQLCVTNTDVNHLFGSILDLCGNCCMFILKYWDKLEQYMTELKTDEMYDFELRKALLNNSDHTYKDLNLIPTILNNSKESMLNAAEHCYLRALALESNIENKNNLNKQLGNVYNEYIILYTEEIFVAITNNIPLNPLKLKLFTKKSKQFFTLGSDIFKKINDEDNLTLINSNSANLYKYIEHYSTKYKVPINEFIKKEIFNFKNGNAYKKRLSKLGDRSSNPQLWDKVYYQLSSTLFYAAVHAYLDICRRNSNNYRECINLFMEALKYCDLENDSPNRFVYEYQVAYINLGLASLSSDRLEKYITKKSSELHPVFLQIMSYCNIAFEMYFKIKRPLESFEVLIKMITLDMRYIDRMIDLWNLKNVESIIRTLGKCIAVFQMFSENKDTIKYLHSTDQPEELAIEDDLHFEMRKLHFFLILEENVLKLLKCMIHLAFNKSPVRELKWLVDKEDELKTMYSLLLRNNIGENGYSQLMIAVQKLSTFK
ncbi:erythroid differentiation-related factor 1-like [Rhopalosiphum maidis]|uniref:erythroid differentiation-related factor 1-like n=1 Tax=Rhopalosiphum maidis TaxID=43146 RepID=UPI000F0053F1|nr:erythroid differentiation-related factor 1-like [Rhopalosiphum maidis]